jgi:UTP--glucose-1-phosphate uridylyltransferase
MHTDTVRKVVIPAGGLGTRLAPLTHLIPKEMLPLGNQVVLQHVIRECDAAGLNTMLIVLNRRKTALFPVAEETPAERDPITGISRRTVYFANQEQQGGLAHALLHAEAFVGSDHFVVALGDTLIHGGEQSLLRRMIEAHREQDAAVTLAVQEVAPDRVSRYGILEPCDAPGDATAGAGEVVRVRRVVEKPRPEAAPSNLAITARYVLSPEIFAACRACGPEDSGEINLAAAFTHLAEAGRPVIGVRLGPGEHRLDIGNPQSYQEAFRRMTVEPNAEDGP